MNNKESRRLLAYHYASRNRPTMSRRVTSRRQAKSIGNATGRTDLKYGKITSEVSVERVFNKRK